VYSRRPGYRRWAGFRKPDFVSQIEVDAAGKADAAVNNGDLAVIAVVGGPTDAGLEWVCRIELDDFRASLPQLFEKRIRGVA